MGVTYAPIKRSYSIWLPIQNHHNPPTTGRDAKPVKVEIVMSTEISSDLAPLGQRMDSEKRFLNESDVLAEGLRLLQARKTLHAEVKKGFDQ
ncbi:hypothetical protein [Novipirellula caenicola]|uniref:hypothetical protein n=1 Tax=Novipirellula caenicola TaxID=1536901 RepID=UPI0031E77D8B